MRVIDIETYDLDAGNYAKMKEGRILCVGTYDGKQSLCFTPDDDYLAEILASDEPKIFHNGIYDLSWLICHQGLKVGGVWHDTMTRAALIDEYADLDLDSCCKRLKVAGKNWNDTIDIWWENFKIRSGMKLKSSWKYSDILWDNEPEYRAGIIKYNKQDCIATYNLFMAQEPYIKEHQTVYDLECRLYPLIMIMRKRGVRVDTVEIERLTSEVKNDLNQIVSRLDTEFNITPSIIASPKKLTAAMTMLDIKSPIHTPTGGQSWSADALELIDHPVADLILGVKARVSLLNKYLEASMIEDIVDGRLYTEFSPNKRDDGGTITGRWASRKPNLQNISARDEKHGQKTYGTEMRNCFIADEGCLFGAFDYSAIEAVVLAHYARGLQAEWFRNEIRAGKDYHKIVMDMTGITSRAVVKTMNYGFIYGMGLNTLMKKNIKLFKQLAEENKVSVDIFGANLYRQYHEKFPVIKDTMAWVEEVTRNQGYIDSIGGRRHHKPKPAIGWNGKWSVPYYKMTNYLIQGTAAEILKLGLCNAFEAGVFGDIDSAFNDETILHAHLAVHDEVDFSLPPKAIEAAKELKEHMVSAYSKELTVPISVSCEVGSSWGASNKEEWEKLIAS